jgi:hypothetical protein
MMKLSGRLDMIASQMESVNVVDEEDIVVFNADEDENNGSDLDSERSDSERSETFDDEMI